LVASRQEIERRPTTAARAVRAAALVAFAASLVVVLSACLGAGVDKAGGARHAKAVVLTLEQSDPDYAGAQFATAVAKDSGGAIRIRVSPTWHRDRLDFERGIVEDVRAGTSDLGVVGVRVWDTLGVTSFQALIAPFLVSSLDLERRVLESPLAVRMLTGVGSSGVVGVALLPGPLRMPFGYTRALVGRGDYVGARLGVYPGRVEEATLRSLGATTREYLNLGGASREGAILNLGGIAGAVGYRGKTLATNVVFWPRPETVVMNRKAFEALTPAQQKTLRDAGRQAVGGRLAEVYRLERDALKSICDRKLVTLVTVQPADVAALQAAVRPVYAQLERNALTRALVAAMRKLRARQGTSNDAPVRCPEPGSAGATKLEGSWGSSVSLAALVALGASKAEAATYEGAATLELRDGSWVFHGDHTTVTGSYAVEGDVIRFTMVTCTANPCSPGAVTEYGWSVYRDTLSLARRPGLGFWARLVATPGRRVQ
jgi:TRAP-type C4-dicarboxylate transport system substrate-binding protein